MFFDEPTDFEPGLQLLEKKELLPTDLSADELHSLEREVRERSLFSAKTANVSYLQGVKDGLASIVSGKVTPSTARARLKGMLNELGYTPAKPGIEDLSSSGRINLVLQTNARQVANYMLREKGTTPFALYQFPAWELLRIYPREYPRGTKRGPKGAIVEVPDEAWPARWEKMGGTLSDGKMIARKDDPIWDALGNRENFTDALDSCYPPLAYGSGMGWREVPRAECESLGLLEPGDEVDPKQVKDVTLNGQLKAGSGIDKDLLRLLQKEIGGKIEAGALKLSNCLIYLVNGAVADVWKICDSMAGASRKEILVACAAAGINPNTSATQYAAWKKGKAPAEPVAPKPEPVKPHPIPRPKVPSFRFANEGTKIKGTPGDEARFRSVLRQIGGVHGTIPSKAAIYSATKAEIKALGHPTSYGVFFGGTNKIYINNELPLGQQKATLCHEIGHAIDSSLSGKSSGDRGGKWFSTLEKPSFSRNDTSVHDVSKAINDSIAARTTEVPDYSPKYKAYLGEPEERFARAYAQYIAVKTQDPDMNYILRKEASSLWRKQWQDDEFKPIKEAFDRLFAKVKIT